MGTSREHNLFKTPSSQPPFAKEKKVNLFQSTFYCFIGCMHILLVDMVATILWAQAIPLLQSTYIFKFGSRETNHYFVFQNSVQQHKYNL
jgi:hypothetical protein